MKIDIKILNPKLGKEWKMPSYSTLGSAGMDLVAAIEEHLVIFGGQRLLIPTGFSIALPEGYEAQIRPRSGLALKHGITVLNSPGTIDSDFRNECGVILINHGKDWLRINPGDRIAQMVINKIEVIDWNIVEELPKSERLGGFGSTGVK